MAISLTVRSNTSSLGSAQTHSSASLTPASDSLWLVSGAMVSNDLATTPSVSVSGGAEAYTEIADVSQDDDTPVNFKWRRRLWRQEFGTSPAARTVTIDMFSGSQTAVYSLIICEFTGANAGAPVIQSADNINESGGGTADLNTTATLSTAPESGAYQLAIGHTESENTASTFDAAPSGFTTRSSSTDEFVNGIVMDSTTNTGTGVTHGTATGTHYRYSLAVLEMATAPSLVVPRDTSRKVMLVR